MSSTPMTPGSVDGATPLDSSPPSSPPSAQGEDAEYNPKMEKVGETSTSTATEPNRASLENLERYLAGSQNFSTTLMDQLTKALEGRESKAIDQPKLMTGGTMRGFQLEGTTWLTCLYQVGLSGLLSDEMGLGKTIQLIAFIAWLREIGTYGPILIAAPVSTLGNWMKEFQHWAPTIPVVKFHGPPKERKIIQEQKLKGDTRSSTYPIIVTSHDLCMKERSYLNKFKWKFLIVDEGQRLKNFNCKLVKDLRTLENESRILMTGTPLQNNLAELWSLLNFLIPEAFTNLEQFENMFDFSDVESKKGEKPTMSAEYRAKTINALHSILKPFLLRRIKNEVERDLPKKREYILYAPLTPVQKEMYDKIKKYEIRQYLEEKAIERIGGQVQNLSVKNLKRKANSGTSTPNKSAKSSRSSTPASTRSVRSTRSKRKDYTEVSDRQYFQDLSKSSSPQTSEDDEEEDNSAAILAQARKEVSAKKLQNPIMQLRLVCNTPHLFAHPWPITEDPDSRLVTDSGKMLMLDRLVPALLATNHKILIFSQFQAQLDLLEDWASVLHSWPVCRIDGSVKAEDRQAAISTFSSDAAGVKICLLTTRAGGQGINLAAADTVILFDSDWNPQQDLQAQDRVHRIGQTRAVIVYRLATRGTVEQTLLEKADGKRRLEKIVIQKDKFKGLLATSSSSAEKDGVADEDLDDGIEVYEGGGEGGEVLSEEELLRLTDRSEEAYRREGEGKGGESSRFRTFETTRDGQDLLGDLGR